MGLASLSVALPFLRGCRFFIIDYQNKLNWNSKYLRANKHVNLRLNSWCQTCVRYPQTVRSQCGKSCWNELDPLWLRPANQSPTATFPRFSCCIVSHGDRSFSRPQWSHVLLSKLSTKKSEPSIPLGIRTEKSRVVDQVTKDIPIRDAWLF